MLVVKTTDSGERSEWFSLVTLLMFLHNWLLRFAKTAPCVSAPTTKSVFVKLCIYELCK